MKRDWMKKVCPEMGSGIVGNHLVLLLLCVFSMLVNVDRVIAGAENTPVAEGLRGIFISPQKGKEAARNIGRLGIFLLQHGFDFQTDFDHPFKDADQFRLEISAKRNGWFYVMHRQRDQKLELIWPRMDSDRYLDDNKIVASQPVMIPPEPFSFNFDVRTGLEYFYVIIAAEREVPDLTVVEGVGDGSDAQRKKTQGAPIIADKRIDQIVNFTIRGRRSSDSRAIQSVVSYPVGNDNDKYIYFKSRGEVRDQLTIMEFQLRHE